MLGVLEMNNIKSSVNISYPEFDMVGKVRYFYKEVEGVEISKGLVK